MKLLPLDVPRCIGSTGGPSGHTLLADCVNCVRRTAPRAEAVLWRDPPKQYPCPQRIGANEDGMEDA